MRNAPKIFNVSNNPPPILYKYIPFEYALSVLQSLQLRVTPPIEFNDPFELSPRAVGTLPRDYVERLLKRKSHERAVYEQAQLTGEFRGSRREFLKEFRGKRGKHVNDAIIGSKQIHRKVLPRWFLEQISKEYGILCLSAVADDILMWSHYASGHRGIVIGIAIPGHWKLHAIDYTAQRPAIDLSKSPYFDNVEEILYAMIKSKSNHWKYEKEQRVLSPLNNLEQKAKDGHNMYFVTLQPNLITEIRLGLRFPEETLSQVHTIHQTTLPHTRLLKAGLHDDAYELVFKEFKPVR